MIKVSVIAIGYNIKNYIKRCIHSIQEQTLKDIEIIYVDDGSNDGTLDIVRQMAKSDFRIKIIEQKNSGPYIARMNGLENSNGEYFTFVDGDDWIEPNTIRYLFEKAKKYELNVVLYDSIRDNYLSNTSIHNQLLIENDVILNRNEISKYILPKFMSNTCFSAVTTKLYNLKYVKGLNISKDIKIKYGEDMLFLLKIFDNLDRTMYIEKEFYHYCVNQKGTLSQIHNENAFFDIYVPLFNYRIFYAKKWGVLEELYINTSFMGICEFSYDFKYKKENLKKYFTNEIFRNSIEKSSIIQYKKIFGKSKTIVLLVVFKAIFKFIRRKGIENK